MVITLLIFETKITTNYRKVLCRGNQEKRREILSPCSEKRLKQAY